MGQYSVFRRYRDYVPLWNDHISTGKPKRRWSPGSIAVGVSVFLNAILLWRWWAGPKLTALDNYQHLNEYSLLAPDIEIPSASSENAIVTSLYTDAFATAVATLGHTINNINSSASKIMIYLPDKTSPRAVCIASASGFTPHPVARIPPPHPGVHRHFLDQYSKLQLWDLERLSIKSLVYLDADTLVYRNFDELFSLPYRFAAVPDVYLDERGFSSGFNAGMLFLRPSREVLKDMVSKIATANYPAEDAEQSFLNHYFGKEVLRLPFTYNGNLAIKKRTKAMWEDLKENIHVVHYTLVKPFLQGDYAEVPINKLEKNIDSKMGKHGGIFVDELNEWAKAWKETKEKYGDAFADCEALSSS